MLCDRIFFSLPGLSDSQIGNMLGIRRQSVQGWRTGKSRPTIPQIHIISQKTKISIRWFISGKTSDHLSVAQAFYPEYYDRKSVIDLKSYRLAREAAATALLSANDRLFLPVLSFLNNITYHSGHDDPDYKLISNSTTLGLLLQKLPDIATIKVSQQTQELYSQMKRSYIRFPQNQPLYSQYTPAQTDYVKAFTSLPVPGQTGSNLKQPAAILSARDKIRVCGNDLSPAVRHNQQIQISTPVSAQALSENAQHLLLIYLPAGATIKGMKAIDNGIFICRFGYNAGTYLVLSDSRNESAPYIIPHSQIQEIYPVHSVLWD